MNIPGIHHVTAIAADPQRNVDFYAGVLGLRLVKRTVNFDDPGTYHFYFGDAVGSPGTIMTFFPWPRSVAGSSGSGMVGTTAFSIPRDSTAYWTERLSEHGFPARLQNERSGRTAVAVQDHDGLELLLVASDDDDAEASAWSDGPVPADHAIRSFHGVTLRVEDPDLSGRFLMDVFGMSEMPGQGSRLRFTAPGDSPGRIIEIEAAAGAGRGGRGTVHHVAFRARTDEEQSLWRARLFEAGHSVTPVLDRQYFRSIYFREPGGVLFEIATDAPGFDHDEEVESLGTALKLPAWLEPRRTTIEEILPPIEEKSYV
jgi:glyoxalase family protein